jgi:hypothetical protein
VTLIHDNAPVEIPQNATVTINAHRTDGGQKSFEGVVNGDNTVTVPLAYWMLELDGTVKCDISVIDVDNDSKLTSTTFYIEVEKAAYSDGDIEHDLEDGLLIDIIKNAKEVYITLPASEWVSLDGEYLYTYHLRSLAWEDNKRVNFGLPVPTTRANADAFANANIIIVSLMEGSGENAIVFSAKNKPTTDITVAITGIVQ